MAHKIRKATNTKPFPQIDNVRRGSGALGNTTDKLRTRKLPGHHKADPETQIPHPRGCHCYAKTEGRYK